MRAAQKSIEGLQPAASRAIARLQRLGLWTMPLPRRLESRLREQDLASERLIAVAQIGGIALFLAAWALTPAGLQVEGYIDYTPLLLLAYLLTVTVRLFLLRKGAAPNYVIAGAILVDVAVLIALIIALPLSLAAPPGAALKHSAFAFLFVIVALRGLRFHPFWALFSAGTAAAGWLLLALWAAMAEPGHVTMNVKDYLYGPLVLPAAEFDRIAALTALGIVIALIVLRARNFVHEAIAGRAAEADLSRFFASDVARQITASEAPSMPGDGMRRMATIVFFDLRGFSKLAAEREASHVLALLSAYHRFVLPIVADHGGSIDKFMGDGILVSFGAVTPSMTHARDALETIRTLSHGLSAWEKGLTEKGLPAVSIGAAAASGEVLFGVIGFGDRLEYTVIGDCVNVAAKLEKHTKTEVVRALAAAETYDLARRQGFTADIEIRRKRMVAGLAHPIDLAVIEAQNFRE